MNNNVLEELTFQSMELGLYGQLGLAAVCPVPMTPKLEPDPAPIRNHFMVDRSVKEMAPK